MRFSCRMPTLTLRVALLLSPVFCFVNSTVAVPAELPRDTGSATPVKTVVVAQKELRKSTVQPATVHAFYVASIQSRVSGYVKEVKVDIGDVVAAADPLMIVDVPELAVARLRAVAEMEQQQAEEGQATAGIQLANSHIKAAEATAREAQSKMAQVEASLAAAEAEFRRTEDLVSRGAMQPRVLDEVREKRDSEVASRQAVTAAIQSAKAAVEVAKSKLLAATADVKAAAAMTRVRESQVAEIDQLISFATLRAPFAGVVTSRQVSPGDLVTKNQADQPLLVVRRLDKVRVHIPVPEKDAALVDRGDDVILTFPSFSAEAAMTAKVTRFAGSLDPSTRTMLVEAEVSNSDGRLLPGMFGQAVITLSTQQAANILPARAVRFTETGDAYVYVVQEDEVSVVSVSTGLDDGHRIEIVSGLQAGQIVVDAHIQRLRDGQKIRVLN